MKDKIKIKRNDLNITINLMDEMTKEFIKDIKTYYDIIISENESEININILDSISKG